LCLRQEPVPRRVRRIVQGVLKDTLRACVRGVSFWLDQGGANPANCTPPRP
jgi:hypothetical protein